MTRALALLSGPRPLDYGSRLDRLRWRRAVHPDRVVEWEGADPARQAVAGAETWVVVRTASAWPALTAAPFPEPPAGRVLVAGAAAPLDPPFVHTLRELERARLAEAAGSGPNGPPAFAFRAADFPVDGDETVNIFIQRLLANESTRALDPGFRSVAFGDPSDPERSELTRRLPGGSLEILDAGCGAGAGIAAAKARNPGWRVTGIERDPVLAARARRRCDRVLEGDLMRILPELARAGGPFGAIVFADVLEHLQDPVAALVAGRRVAAAQGMVLVSVPNVAHLSLARDLLAGRFDPVAAGLTDARHLRWFTRESLSEALEEAGWRGVSIEGEAGAPAPDPEEFLALAASWPDCDRESLMTYQWVAVGVTSDT